MKTSKLFSLNIQDFLKALIIATLTPVLVVVQSTIDAGSLTFDWKHIGMAAVAGFVGYLIKNFFTPQQVIQKANDSNQPTQS